MRADRTVVEKPDLATYLAWRAGATDLREVFVMGPRTRARYFLDGPGPRCVKLRLSPGRAARVLGRPVRDLADRAVPLADLDAAPLRRNDEVVDRALALLAAGGERESLDRVARRLGVSERHLRNVFTDAVGLPPSTFVRLDRVRAVLSRLGDDLATVAADVGYYDQSHLTADFRRVMGAPPRAYAGRRWPAAEECPARG